MPPRPAGRAAFFSGGVWAERMCGMYVHRIVFKIINPLILNSLYGTLASDEGDRPPRLR